MCKCVGQAQMGQNINISGKKQLCIYCWTYTQSPGAMTQVHSSSSLLFSSYIILLSVKVCAESHRTHTLSCQNSFCSCHP